MKKSELRQMIREELLTESDVVTKADLIKVEQELWEEVENFIEKLLKKKYKK